MATAIFATSLKHHFPPLKLQVLPIRYASAIQAAYAKKLGSDTAYSRLITKNPFKQALGRCFLSKKTYSLDYLVDFVDLNDKPTAEDRIQGLGRNCTIFDLTRFWAYKAVLPYLESKSSYQAWFNAVLERKL